MTKPFYEQPEFRESNRYIENSIGASAAILSDNRDGVALFLGRFRACLTRDGAFLLATLIADALQEDLPPKNERKFHE